MYQVRKAVFADMDKILDIYAHARRHMAQNGNPRQWGETYPPAALVESDIAEGSLYVVEDREIRGVFAFFTEPDPTYSYIENGTWLSDLPYGTIHRVASDGSGGVFSAVLQFALSQNPHLRIDTHEDNHIMQHVLEKHGFSIRGVIYLEDGDSRIAFERV